MSDTPARRSTSTLAAIALGLPTAAAVLAAFHFGPLRHTPAFRYVEWPTQWVLACFFCTGLGVLLVRLWALRGERAALGRDLLPRWDGKPVGVETAGELLAALRRQPRQFLGGFLGRRLDAILGFVCQRKSAAGLDDQMRSLADADAMHHDAGLGFIRFITWAIPILGFLGTVVGITGAIGGVTPEKLESNMSDMTNGLAEAFDATALALGCTMALMFLNFLVERREQSLLTDVDDEADRLLAHRFAQPAADEPLAAAIREQARALESFGTGPGAMAVQAFDQIHQRVLGGMAGALEQALTQHAERLGSLEQQAVGQTAQLMIQLGQLAETVRETGQQQNEALYAVARAISGQAAALSRIQEGEANLIQLQSVLHQNLAAVAAAGNFEEAVHSLTAAVHLLTARAGSPGPRLANHGRAA